MDLQVYRNFKARIAELEAEISKLRHTAERDGLTGCLRREALFSLIESRRKFGLLSKNMSAVVVDIDHFKRVNDSWGHATGDEVLKSVSAMLQDLSPEGSLVCRMGGEEFLILMPMDANAAYAQTEKLRLCIAAEAVKLESGYKIAVTASFGVSKWDSDQSLNAAISIADQRLYRAKNEGRNRVAA